MFFNITIIKQGDNYEKNKNFVQRMKNLNQNIRMNSEML